MSNTKALKFLLGTLMVSTFSNMTCAETYPVEAKLSGQIYCPEKLECTRGWCNTFGGNAEYWVKSNGKVPLNGIYNFSGASGTYQYQAKEITSVYCSYNFSGTSPFPNEGVRLEIKQEGNFEAYFDNATNWALSDSHNATCLSDTPSSCPVIEKTSLIINQSIVGQDGYYLRSLRLKIATNGIIFPHDFNGRYDHYILITYEDALNACGTVNQCTIYIAEKGDILKENLATVTIDMTDKMRIIGVTTPKRASYTTVRKHPLFNVVQFVGK